MIPILPFLAGNWKPLLLGLAVLLVLSAGYQGAQLYERRRATKQVEATVAQHTQRLATDAQAREPADSLRHVLEGRRLELYHEAYYLQQDDESLSQNLPAPVTLPAEPERE